MQGKFITLEGIEGSGKSTSIKDIKNILDFHSIDHIVTKEPGGSPIGQDLRALLLNKDSKISSEVELLLMMADRKSHLDNLVLPSLKKGIWVISDRYLDSTYAYQGGGREIEFSIIDNLSSLLKLPSPDLTLLFDCSIDVGLSRAKSRAKLDRFEDEDRHFHEHVYQTYQDLAKKHANRFHIIQADDSILNVQNQMFQVLSTYINQLSS